MVISVHRVLRSVSARYSTPWPIPSVSKYQYSTRLRRRGSYMHYINGGTQTQYVFPQMYRQYYNSPVPGQYTGMF